jgi:O-antigen/teichoic acid export membrane protein
MLAQKLALSYSSKIGVQAVQMVAMFIVARIVGPTVLGTLAFGLAFVSMFLFIADLGLGSAHIKLISEGQDESKCIGTFAVIKSVMILVFSLTVLGYYIVQKYILQIAFESMEHEYVILIYLLITTINQFFAIPSTTFAAKTEQAKQDIPNFLQITLYSNRTGFLKFNIGCFSNTFVFIFIQRIQSRQVQQRVSNDVFKNITAFVSDYDSSDCYIFNRQSDTTISN